jgi:hypothetical protein
MLIQELRRSVIMTRMENITNTPHHRAKSSDSSQKEGQIGMRDLGVLDGMERDLFVTTIAQSGASVHPLSRKTIHPSTMIPTFQTLLLANI